MLEKIREGSQGIAAKIILGLIVLTFAISGVGGYINTRGDNAAATVNGEGISASELERAYRNQRARLESQFGEMFQQLAADPEYMANFRSGVLDNLIDQTLSDQLAKDLGLRVSDAQVKQAILEMEEFHVNGQFDNDRYQRLLQNAGYQPSTFRDVMRADMTRRQLLLALTESEFSLDFEATAYKRLQQQQRDFSYAEIEAEQFKEGITVTDEALQAFYQENIESYESDEQVILQYIELKVADLTTQVEVSEQEIQEYYDANPSAYVSDERRRASHILISAGDDDAAAQTKAQELLSQIQSGADFAKLAEANSNDTFSAQNGGDLNFFGKGVMAPEFEEATYALENIGDVSEVVKTSFGFHIIKLTEIDAESVQPLEQVSAQIEATLKMDKANILFGEKQQLVADLAFEISDSLEEAATEAGVELKESQAITRNTVVAPFNNAKLQQAAFSTDVVENGYNSELIEISNDHLIVVRAIEHKPSRTLALDEVKDKVNSAVLAQQSAELAKEWATTTLAQWQQGEDISALLTEKGAELKSVTGVTRFAGDATPAIRQKAFELAKPAADKQTFASIDSAVTVSLIRLEAVNDQQVDADDASKQRLQSALSGSNYQAVLEALKAKSEIVKPALTVDDNS